MSKCIDCKFLSRGEVIASIPSGFREGETTHQLLVLCYCDGLHEQWVIDPYAERKCKASERGASQATRET